MCLRCIVVIVRQLQLVVKITHFDNAEVLILELCPQAMINSRQTQPSMFSAIITIITQYGACIVESYVEVSQAI